MNERPITRLADLSPAQWKSGLAAWLGWLFDGLDMHLYTLVASFFVPQLLGVEQKHPDVDWYSSIIQAAFLVGWALGGGFFGRVGDRLGRSRALMLTILTYALFTGFSFFAQTWWQLMLCRFVAALGIGGEWAVGASLLSETWPRQWRPWLAAVLQSAVNMGVLLAVFFGMVMAEWPPRYVFLVGIVPAFLTLWIRRAVPETEEWHAARQEAKETNTTPGLWDLFGRETRRTTLLTILVCSFSLSAHWAFMFWYQRQLSSLPDVSGWTDPAKRALVGNALLLLMVFSIVGNFLAAAAARTWGYRPAIIGFCLAYCGALWLGYGFAHSVDVLLWVFMPLIGMSQGVFGLFTMYLPPLFPTLLRTTGAGFCYNIGRIAAAFGTVFFGLISKVGDQGVAIRYAGLLFLPAAAVALLLHEPPDERPARMEEPIE